MYNLSLYTTYPAVLLTTYISWCGPSKFWSSRRQTRNEELVTSSNQSEAASCFKLRRRCSAVTSTVGADENDP